MLELEERNLPMTWRARELGMLCKWCSVVPDGNSVQITLPASLVSGAGVARKGCVGGVDSSPNLAFRLFLVSFCQSSLV